MKNKKEKPTLNLILVENIAIGISTIKDYDTMMQICEVSKYGWFNTHNLPTETDHWKIYKEKTYITFTPKGILYSSENFFKNFLLKPISFDEFLKFEGIHEIKIKEISSWFNKNKPNRISKISDF